MITITDQNTGQTATCQRDEVADTIEAWFPGAPAEVTDAIDDLQVALDRREYTGELEAYLGITLA